MRTGLIIAAVFTVLYIIRTMTGPFLYHILKGIFWVWLAYRFDQWMWSLIAAWDMIWLIIWVERDPNSFKENQ